MKNTTSKFISAGLTIASLAMAPSAFANDTTTNTTNTTPSRLENRLANLENKNQTVLTITGINGNTITGTDKTGTTFTVDASSAKIVRRFQGSATISELAVNNKISIKGTVTSNSIVATSIRDLSLQTKNGNLTGTISNLSTDSFTLTNKQGVAYTVNTTPTTKYTGSKTHTISSLANLANGDTVLVLGLKDTSNKIETATSIRYFDKSTMSGKHLKTLKNKLHKTEK